MKNVPNTGHGEAWWARGRIPWFYLNFSTPRIPLVSLQCDWAGF